MADASRELGKGGDWHAALEHVKGKVVEPGRELVDTGCMTDRSFHDAVLLQNAIPIELVRAALTDAELSPDMRSTWRFEGPW
jgi:hypothetical protein